MPLTKSAITKMVYAKEGNKQDIRWDDSLAGFGVRVYPSGKKSFVLSYRHSGRKHIIVLGQYGQLTLAQAKKSAKDELAKLRLTDADPAAERKKRRQGDTVGDLCLAYLKDYAKIHKKSWRDDERRINNRILPAWKNLKANGLSHTDIAALHRQIGAKHPYEANRVVELISKMYHLAAEWGVVPRSIQNPAHGIKAFKEEKRDRWVSPEELPRLIEAIERESNIYARYALWLYLLTGVRKNELLHAKWSDIDFQRGELCLADTKNGKKHYVPLSTAALSVLEKIPRQSKNPYIIVGNVSKKHLINIDKPWRRVRKRAQVEDLRLHDLRRTVGSWLAQSGNSLHLIGRILNHSDTKTTEIYARFAQDQLHTALERHGQQLLSTVENRNPQ